MSVKRGPVGALAERHISANPISAETPDAAGVSAIAPRIERDSHLSRRDKVEIMIDWHGVAVSVRGELVSADGGYSTSPADLYVDEICVGEESDDISGLLTGDAQDEIRQLTIQQIYENRISDEMDIAENRADWMDAA